MAARRLAWIAPLLSLCGCHLLLPLSPSIGDGTAGDQARHEAARRDAPGLEVSSPPRDGALDRRGEVVPLTLASGEDDGEIMFDSPDLSKNGEPYLGLMMGSYNGGYTWGYFRFRPAQPLAAGSICEARLTLGALSTDPKNGWASALRILVESSPDPPDLTTAAQRPDFGLQSVGTVNVSVRWPAAGTLSWPVPDGVATSEDLKVPLQLLADSAGGLQHIKAVRVWIRGDTGAPGTTDAEVGTADLLDTANAAVAAKNRLVITLCL